MRRLNLGNDAETLRLELPIEWNPADLTGLTLTINDQSGNELMVAAAVTLWTPTTLDGAVAACSTSCTLAAGSDDLAPGDGIMVIGAGGRERMVVKGYAALVAEVDTIFSLDFADGDDVYGLFGTIEVDLSDTSVFPAGQELLLIWTPAGSGGPITEEAVISSYRQVDIAGLREELRDVYPRAYVGLTVPRDRLERIAARARNDIRKQLLAMDQSLELNTIRDQDLILPAVAAQCAVLWTLNGDDELDNERATFKEQVSAELALISTLDVWGDSDGDLVDDPLERRDHPPVFHNGW